MLVFATSTPINCHTQIVSVPLFFAFVTLFVNVKVFMYFRTIPKYTNIFSTPTPSAFAFGSRFPTGGPSRCLFAFLNILAVFHQPTLPLPFPYSGKAYAFLPN